MNICIITDNSFMYEELRALVLRDDLKDYKFDFYYTKGNVLFSHLYGNTQEIRPIKLREKTNEFWGLYQLFISCHSKQIFPDELVTNYTCINIHPGYNPYNRGWFPQVFSLINKLPVGVTIHRMDEQLDHGSILYQEKVEVLSSDTSKTIYDRIMALECKMLSLHIKDIVAQNYQETPAIEEGNVNYKKDFENLCLIDLNKTASYGEVIDHLRACTFPPYKNAYFIDKSGNKVFVEITLHTEL